MKTYYVMDYKNGNRAIIEKSEYEKEMKEQYGIEDLENDHDEAIVGTVESETVPNWDDLEFGEGEYRLREIRHQMTAAEFATLNDIEVDEIKLYSDACTGAEDLNPDTELGVAVEDGEIRVTRSDNPWNEPVDVVYGPAENWTYEK